MRKFQKKVVCILTAAVISAGALSFAACGENGFTPVAADNSGSVESNGGFVVSTKDYYYFINGVEDYSADNTYGGVVKGALMRVKKSDVEAKENKAETVIPSLMVAADYTSGLYIYGDRIYYATPNNVRSTSGVIESDYLDFKSVKTDGTDIQSITRVSDNSTKYRYVEEGDAVYLVYVDGTELHSFNTATKKDTVLVDGGTYLFHDTDKTNAYVYYTMSVTDQQDTDNSVSYKYNQIYRVNVAQTTAAYEYTWDQDWLDENNEGEVPYTNLGELVLDGISRTDNVTQFNHDVKDADGANDNRPAIGYTYTLQNYVNGGIYFTRKLVSTPGSTVGSTGELYFVGYNPDMMDSIWNSVERNELLTTVANSTNTSKASSSALFYIDKKGGHHYVYVSGQYIYRADVGENGAIAEEQEIAYNVSGAELVSLDLDSDDTYQYVYFTRTNGSGRSVERAVINGDAENYKNLQFENNDNAPYAPVKLLDVQHASGWYQFEILDNNLFYVNAESFGTSLNYVYTVNLKRSGALMNNKEIEALNDKYNDIFSEDTKDPGYLKQVSTDGNKNYVSTNYSSVLKYYFYTGETKLFDENIQEAIDAGYKNTYLYSVTEQDAFKAFTGENSEALAQFKDGDNNYFSLGYFTTFLGEMNEDDAEAYENYWKTSVLKAYIAPEAEEEGLAWWAWLLIGVAIAAVVAGVVVAVVIVTKKRGKDGEPKPERMRVDTTDDKDVDVYNMGGTSAAPAEEVEGSAEESVAAAPAEVVEEPAEETAAVEEPAEESVAEEPVAETEEQPEETPEAVAPETAASEEPKEE